MTVLLLVAIIILIAIVVIGVKGKKMKLLHKSEVAPMSLSVLG